MNLPEHRHFKPVTRPLGRTVKSKRLDPTLNLHIGSSTMDLASLLRYGAPAAEPTNDGVLPVRPGPSIPPPRTRAEAEQQLRDARRNGQLSPNAIAREVPTLDGRDTMLAQQPGPEEFNPLNAGFAAFDPAGMSAIAPRITEMQGTNTLTGREQNLQHPVSDQIPRPNASERLSGSMVTPWNAVMRGGQAAINALPRAVTAAPRTAATSAAIAAATAAPSEATPPQDPTAGPQQPSLLSEMLRALGANRPDDQRPLTQDEFLQARRRLQPKTEADYIESEVAKVRDSDRWRTGGKGLRENIEAAARNNAREAFAGHQRGVDQETRTLTNEYASSYRPGWERQRAELLSKGFVERHPNTATALTVGGPLAAGLVTHGVANRTNRALERTGQAAIDSALSNDARSTATNALRAQTQLDRAPWQVYGTAAKMAAVPAELRLGADFVDARALPPDAPARQNAERRMSDLGSYLRGFGQDVASGVVSAATGLGTAGLRRSATGPATAETGAAYLRGIDTARMSPDQIASVIAQRAGRASAQEANAVRAGNDLATARGTPPGGAGDDRSWLARLLRSGQVSNAPAPSIPLTAASDAGQLRALPAPTPTPSRSSLASMLRREGAPANADPSSTRRLPQGFQEDNRLRGSGIRGPNGRVASRPPSEDPLD